MSYLILFNNNILELINSTILFIRVSVILLMLAGVIHMWYLMFILLLSDRSCPSKSVKANYVFGRQRRCDSGGLEAELGNYILYCKIPWILTLCFSFPLKFLIPQGLKKGEKAKKYYFIWCSFAPLCSFSSRSVDSLSFGFPFYKSKRI